MMKYDGLQLEVPPLIAVAHLTLHKDRQMEYKYCSGQCSGKLLVSARFEVEICRRSVGDRAALCPDIGGEGAADAAVP
jgi:hypothetical protein